MGCSTYMQTVSFFPVKMTFMTISNALLEMQQGSVSANGRIATVTMPANA